MHCFPADCFRNGHSAVEPVEQIHLPDLGAAGQHRVVTDDDHAMACRNSNERRASAKISSADWSGHKACLLSMACASQSEPSPSILLICSNESNSLEYASAAKASRAARPRFWNPTPSSVARSSGMSTVKVIGIKICHSSSSSKSKNKPARGSHSNHPPPVTRDTTSAISNPILKILLIDSLPLTLRAASSSLSPLRSDFVKKRFLNPKISCFRKVTRYCETF